MNTKILFVFDYPNIVKTWGRVCHREVVTDDIDWAMMHHYLKAHAHEHFGKDITTEFRIFKNRWSRSGEQDKIRKLRKLGYKYTLRKKDIKLDSDIDCDIRDFVASELRAHEDLIVYLVGNDLKNYIPILRLLKNNECLSWLVSIPSGFTGFETPRSLPEYTYFFDLESVRGILRRPDDLRAFSELNAQSRGQLSPIVRSRATGRARARNKSFKKASIDTTMKGIRKSQ